MSPNKHANFCGPKKKEKKKENNIQNIACKEMVHRKLSLYTVVMESMGMVLLVDDDDVVSISCKINEDVVSISNHILILKINFLKKYFFFNIFSNKKNTIRTIKYFEMQGIGSQGMNGYSLLI
jgi:hypothetical protein